MATPKFVLAASFTRILIAVHIGPALMRNLQEKGYTSLLSIAFAANVVRVIILVLVTYHFGDEAGQGFVHGFAGILLFIISLLFLFALDGALGWLLPDRPKDQAR